MQRELWHLQQSSQDPELQSRPCLSPVGQILAEIWRFAPVLEVILQLIARAGKVPPRRAWLLVGGPLEVCLRPILPGPFWAFPFKEDKSRSLKVERRTLVRKKTVTRKTEVRIRSSKFVPLARQVLAVMPEMMPQDGPVKNQTYPRPGLALLQRFGSWLLRTTQTPTEVTGGHTIVSEHLCGRHPDWVPRKLIL